jgi:hypothetical protein
MALHRRAPAATGHDGRILRVEEEAGPVGPGQLGDVPVTEVEAEELGVRLRLDHDLT